MLTRPAEERAALAHARHREKSQLACAIANALAEHKSLVATAVHLGISRQRALMCWQRFLRMLASPQRVPWARQSDVHWKVFVTDVPGLYEEAARRLLTELQTGSLAVWDEPWPAAMVRQFNQVVAPAQDASSFTKATPEEADVAWAGLETRRVGRQIHWAGIAFRTWKAPVIER